MNLNRTFCGTFIFIVLWIGVTGCEKDDPLAPEITLSGKVTNSSGQSGPVIVEIEHYLRDTADSEGRFEIRVHQDFFVDSLYAWVDGDGDGRYTRGEPYGFYHGQDNPARARMFQVRDYDISNLNFSIP